MSDNKNTPQTENIFSKNDSPEVTDSLTLIERVEKVLAKYYPNKLDRFPSKV